MKYTNYRKNIHPSLQNITTTPVNLMFYLARQQFSVENNVAVVVHKNSNIEQDIFII